jgi:GNAT superfamily N-acetyltransferase
MNTDKVTIRKASVNDVETLIEYRILFLKETYGAPPPEKESYLRKTLMEYFTRSFKNYSFISWIAEYENKPVGFSGLVIRDQPGNFEVPNGKTGYILNMFTLKDFRKNGICKLLFQKLIDESKQLNLDKIELHATNDGELVYRQFGFAEPHDKALEKKLR